MTVRYYSIESFIIVFHRSIREGLDHSQRAANQKEEEHRLSQHR